MSQTAAQRAVMLAEFHAIQHDVEHAERQMPVDAAAHAHVLERLARFRLKLRLVPSAPVTPAARAHEEPS